MIVQIFILSCNDFNKKHLHLLLASLLSSFRQSLVLSDGH